jgi:flagellar biosynthetic protein FliR
MTAGNPATMEAAWAIALTMAGPLLASVRILGLLWFGGLMAGITVPWRYRVAGSLLLGWTAGGAMTAPDGFLPAMAAAEFTFGAALGIGVGALLQSLKLAGELIDDRLRLNEATGDLLAGGGEQAGPCVRILGGLGLLLVVLGGTTGEMPVLEGLLGSFRRVPPGEAAEAWQNWTVGPRLLGGSIELGIRTALPVLAAVTIVDWCQMLAARAAPTAPSAIAATAVKPLLGLAVLVASFGGVCETAVVAVRACLESGGAG